MGKAIANEDAQIKCIHQGDGTISSPGETKLKINRKSVYTSMSGTINSGNCTQQPPPQTNVPCTAFTIPSGTSTKLTVNGQPVILENDQGTSVGSPTNGCKVENAGQSIFTTD